MNGKQAKRIRKAAKVIAGGQRLPDLKYETKEVTVRRPINTPAGLMNLPVKREIRYLAPCTRQFYKILKKHYKAGVPIFD